MSESPIQPDSVSIFRQEPQGRHAINTPLKEDSVKTAELLSIYKGKFINAVQSLVEDKILHPAVQRRIPLISTDIPLLVTKDPAQKYHFFDPESRRDIMLHLEDPLTTDHEMTHALLPGVSWRNLNEGLVQIVARKINKRIGHPIKARRIAQPEDFYKQNEQILGQVSRITGLTLFDLTEIASGSDWNANAEEINNRAHLTIGGERLGIIDYGKRLEHQGADTVAAMPGMMKKYEMDAAVAGEIVSGLKEVPSIFPSPMR